MERLIKFKPPYKTISYFNSTMNFNSNSLAIKKFKIEIAGERAYQLD